jgi:hypothetical protein
VNGYFKRSFISKEKGIYIDFIKDIEENIKK